MESQPQQCEECDKPATRRIQWGPGAVLTSYGCDDHIELINCQIPGNRWVSKIEEGAPDGE
jgi:hypothetical protein